MSSSNTVTANVTTVDFSELDEKLERMANVLNDFKIFGDLSHSDDAIYLLCEKRGFKNMIRTHAESGEWNYLEITYRGSCVRIIVKTRIVGNKAIISAIDAYDHPQVNAKMDYAALNSAMKEI